MDTVSAAVDESRTRMPSDKVNMKSKNRPGTSDNPHPRCVLLVRAIAEQAAEKQANILRTFIRERAYMQGRYEHRR